MKVIVKKAKGSAGDIFRKRIKAEEGKKRIR